jgi:hypothetical protein
VQAELAAAAQADAAVAAEQGGSSEQLDELDDLAGTCDCEGEGGGSGLDALSSEGECDEAGRENSFFAAHWGESSGGSSSSSRSSSSSSSSSESEGEEGHPPGICEAPPSLARSVAL